MVAGRKKYYLLIALTILLLSISFNSCQKRYWYREKIRIFGHFQYSQKHDKTLHLTVNNHSPEYLSEQFKNDIKHFVQYQLEKKGFFETRKDTADFDLTIVLKVDSFHTRGYSKYAGFWDHPNVRQLSIKYQMCCGRYKHACWDFLNEFYFFGDEPVDLRRSIGLVRYSLRQMPVDN